MRTRRYQLGRGPDPEAAPAGSAWTWRRALRPLPLALGVVALLGVARVALRSAPEEATAELHAVPAVLAAPPAETVRPAPLAPHSWDGALAERVARWSAEAARSSTLVRSAADVTVSVCVLDLADGRVLGTLQPDRALPTASNMKLVTTAAALVLLGPEMEFVTAFEAAGPIEDGVLAGDLVVRAGGDPLVARGPEVRLEEPLTALARKLVAGGLVRVTGDLVLDEGAFADPEPAPGWPDESQRWAAYCALSGGFSVNGGVLEALVAPGAVGSKARVEVRPAAHGLARRYDVDTVANGALEVLVGATHSTVTVRGALPAKAGPYAAEFAHCDPVLLFGAVLRGELERAGVRIDGTTVRRRDTPPGAPLASLHSALAGVLPPINADSRNGVADQVFLTLGRAFGGEGSRAGGERATRLALERLGVSAAGLVQADGSGLSRDNRASARQIAALVAAVLGQGGEEARLFRSSLAVAGESGTLEDRLVDGPARGRVRAKTGWIAGVSALSGVLETTAGRELVFSILVSYPREAGGLNTSCFKPMQDEIVSALVEEAL